MTETDKAYLAGLIDGEGCITMTAFSSKYMPDTKTKLRGKRSTLVRVFIIMCDGRNIFDWLRNITGSGYTFFRKRPNKHPTWKDSYGIIWHGKDAKEMLIEIFPYLRLKTRQAQLIIDWVTKSQDLIHNPRWKKGTKGGIAFSPDVLKYRDSVIDEIRALNRKGQ